MVLDIRKDLLQRKQKSQPKSSARSNPNGGPLALDSETAENLEGPFSVPPCSYDPLVFHLHNSLSREAQPRPLRVPCSACTFVPHAKQSLALSRCRSQQLNHHKLLPSVAAHADCATIDEEPCAEDIAGDHRDFTVECVSTQPIRVACIACTSSLRASSSYGHAAVAPKVKLRKRIKHRNISSPEAMAMATMDCSVQDLHHDCERAAVDSGWFVRPEQVTCTSPLSSAMVRQPSQSTALRKKKSLSVVPVEVDAIRKVERIEGHSPHESIAVTYQVAQSCQNISDMIPENTQLAERKPYQHDCFVKRVERACAKATGSKVPAADRRRMSRNRSSSSMSRHERWNSMANVCEGRLEQPAASWSGDDQYPAAVGSVNRAEDRLYEQHLDMSAGAGNRSDVSCVIQAVSDIASISMQEKSRKEKYASRHDSKKNSLSDLQQSKSTSQEDPNAVVPPRVSVVGAAVGEKNNQRKSIYSGAPGAAVQKRSISVTFPSKEHAEALQITHVDSHSQTTKKCGEHEEKTTEQQLRLSVEVFPSPSAPKGFGLKIVQHFPKMVDVEYVNGLGLSPRSFQTVACQRCSSSSPPLNCE